MAFSTLMKISDKTWRFNARFRFGYKFGSNLEETRGGKSSLFWRISGSEWKPWLWATQIQLQRVLSLKMHLHVEHICDRCDIYTCATDVTSTHVRPMRQYDTCGCTFTHHWINFLKKQNSQLCYAARIDVLIYYLYIFIYRKVG